jgi:hypothetical protein
LSIPAPAGIGLVRSRDISQMATSYQIVLRHEDVDRPSQEILARYSVPADRSPDLMALKPSPAAGSIASRILFG